MLTKLNNTQLTALNQQLSQAKKVGVYIVELNQGTYEVQFTLDSEGAGKPNNARVRLDLVCSNVQLSTPEEA